ncbi:hypothetical protein lotta81_gp016 [Flavobacterium phage vB_FspM_lotta8-1]|uniref:Uncharacterized protein n=3 Tax=Pippivirus TaxID=2843435 RepID=A0A6B9LKE1_9CAUD|nr:hypothetical protein HWC85_gp16 [Flavobacterium phage vB_FspM_lotta8-1]YP_009854546.1 hypothetical protein HWC86_gp15 [Flavobacterium phage vB_FspM_pippi8-1]QHB38474.1 hypothetical protein lotta81_gp016 [Flavobacterium phage vB_FspM_lotta8-1]QHB38526.1 hypothetical protein lotta82_gp015 [Flavobacterium phage vB_FspM_lotta8-2]QHB38579.1 hypothetical protein pippi81_gp015 [Flavobacterium phage vB_FspM_pippi8-1]
MTQEEYKITEIENILAECRRKIGELSLIVNPSEIMVFIPDYFRKIIDSYFRATCQAVLCEICFGTGSTFYGVKHFYPSPNNTIIISCLKNAAKKESVEFIIKLK